MCAHRGRIGPLTLPPLAHGAGDSWAGEERDEMPAELQLGAGTERGAWEVVHIFAVHCTLLPQHPAGPRLGRESHQLLNIPPAYLW